MQKKKQHLKNPWITREIIHAKRRANRLRKANKNNPKPSTTLKLKSAVMHFKQKLKDSKQYYYSVTLANFLKDNPQRFWKHLRSTEQTTTKLTEEEKSATANKYNNFFKSVFTEDNGTLPLFHHPVRQCLIG